MRNTGFIRTPIRVDDQSFLQNLQVSEQPLVGNPAVTDPYPQTLQLSFAVAAGTTAVQIAPLWEGSLTFLADDTSTYPTTPADVTIVNFPNWNLVGDLVLRNSDGLVDTFAAQIPLVSPPPSAVRYSKVRLTQDFLFTTLSKVSFPNFTSGGIPVTKKDPQWLQKFILSFLLGHASAWCSVDLTDATKDFAYNPMPSVNLAVAGATTTFKVTIATQIAELIDMTWFNQNPAYDGISGETLVDPAIDTFSNQRFNPAHPSHSVISALALFQNASDAAYATGYTAATALRASLSAPLPTGTYRRIDLIRPPAPGTTTTAYLQRPFPMYQLVWRPTGGGAFTALRIPLTGRLYLPLVDGSYTFWAIPRSQDPNTVLEGDQLQLSVKTSPHLYIDLPSPTLTMSFVAGESNKVMYADLLEYDSLRVWTALKDLGNDYLRLEAAAEARWNVNILNLFIYRSATMADYASIYGYIRASAGRHGFAPEFLHAVFMGEGVGSPGGLIEKNRANGVAFSETQVIDGFDDLGLDNIQDTLPVLIANNYLDSSFSGVLSNPRTEVNELGQLVHTADVAGWKAAIEIVAAELHSRLDEMLTYCTANSISITTEVQRRFLAYARYNASLATAQNYASHLSAKLTKWTNPRPDPSDQSHADYNTIQRIAITEWYEASQVYR